MEICNAMIASWCDEFKKSENGGNSHRKAFSLANDMMTSLQNIGISQQDVAVDFLQHVKNGR